MFCPNSTDGYPFLIAFTTLGERCTSLRDLNKDTPMVKEGRKRWKEEKCPASGEIGTHDIPITRRVLYRCAANFNFLKI